MSPEMQVENHNILVGCYDVHTQRK